MSGSFPGFLQEEDQPTGHHHLTCSTERAPRTPFLRRPTHLPGPRLRSSDRLPTWAGDHQSRDDCSSSSFRPQEPMETSLGSNDSQPDTSGVRSYAGAAGNDPKPGSSREGLPFSQSFPLPRGVFPSTLPGASPTKIGKFSSGVGSHSRVSTASDPPVVLPLGLPPWQSSEPLPPVNSLTGARTVLFLARENHSNIVEDRVPSLLRSLRPSTRLVAPHFCALELVSIVFQWDCPGMDDMSSRATWQISPISLRRALEKFSTGILTQYARIAYVERLLADQNLLKNVVYGGKALSLEHCYTSVAMTYPLPNNPMLDVFEIVTGDLPAPVWSTPGSKMLGVDLDVTLHGPLSRPPVGGNVIRSWSRPDRLVGTYRTLLNRLKSEAAPLDRLFL